ncbi:IS21 family transposase, partial [Salipaludibacillus sp. CF4.18]
EDLNQVIWQEIEEDRYRPHYEKKKEIARLHEEDKKVSLVLPAKEYQCIRYETLTADKFGYVKVDTKKYSTSPRFAKQKTLVGITYNRID